MRIMMRVASVLALGLFAAFSGPAASDDGTGAVEERSSGYRPVETPKFDVDVMVGDRALEQYPWGGRRYVEAKEGADYEIRVRNPLPVRVAMTLSVDGLNTIDARRTSAREGSQWVILPHQTITLRGWQMSSERARKFYFTTERDSYAARLGRSSPDIGVISAVFFRERTPIALYSPRRPSVAGDAREEGSYDWAKSSSVPPEGAGLRRDREYAPERDRERAGTGIGTSVPYEVRSVRMDLEPVSVAEVTIRYEYREALRRLGVLPRFSPEPDRSRGSETRPDLDDRRFCPEP